MDKSIKEWDRRETRREIAWRRLQSAAQAIVYIRTELVKASARMHECDAVEDDCDGTMRHIVSALEETVALNSELVSAAKWLGYPVLTLFDQRPWRQFVGHKPRKEH
jgi:hypothetical protein